jgi:hypothetical protein
MGIDACKTNTGNRAIQTWALCTATFTSTLVLGVGTGYIPEGTWLKLSDLPGENHDIPTDSVDKNREKGANPLRLYVSK